MGILWVAFLPSLAVAIGLNSNSSATSSPSWPYNVPQRQQNGLSTPGATAAVTIFALLGAGIAAFFIYRAMRTASPADRLLVENDEI